MAAMAKTQRRDTDDETIIAIGDDGVFMPVGKLEAHHGAVQHIAVSIFVFDGDHLLIQKRAQSKYHCGGLWANSFCTHPHWNETADVCAERRLGEELGFSVPLSRRKVVEYSADVGNGLHENEKVTMFTGSADRHTLEIVPDPLEVEDTRWVTRDELHSEIKQHPDRFTPWIRIYAQRYPDLAF